MRLCTLGRSLRAGIDFTIMRLATDPRNCMTNTSVASLLPQEPVSMAVWPGMENLCTEHGHIACGHDSLRCAVGEAPNIAGGVPL